MSETECQIIVDCPDFMYGCCQKYLDGDCSAHKCDLKVIRELQQKLKKIKEMCEPIINISTIDRLSGEQYTGKYILADKILQIIKNEACLDK